MIIRGDVMKPIIDLLVKRGFIIEQEDDRYYLSENAASEDVIYLESLLAQYKLGYINECGEIIITASNDECLKELFEPTVPGEIGVGTCVQMQPWHVVARRDCSNKVPVEWLEANVARYVKALSACGIYTGGCCDGNHVNHDTLYIEFDGPIYMEFHELLWKYQLNNRYDLKWEKNYTRIKLNDDKQSQYEELNKVAEFIYNNRFVIRYIRKKAGTCITKKLIKSYSDEKIKKIFLDEAEKIMKSEEIQWK